MRIVTKGITNEFNFQRRQDHPSQHIEVKKQSKEISLNFKDILADAVKELSNK